jgi:hypothetical protein
MEVKFLLTSGLAMSQPGVLLCISDYQFNLVAQTVVPDDLLGMLSSVGRGEDDLLPLRTDQQYDPKIAPKMEAAGHRRRDPNLRLIRKTAHLIEPSSEDLPVVPVNFPVVLFWSARACFGAPGPSFGGPV